MAHSCFTLIRAMLLGSVLLGVATAPSAHAATTYYVALDGRDSSAGTGAAPFRSIQHAATVAQAGDTVSIRVGSYREQVTPQQSRRTGADLVDRTAWQQNGAN